MTKETLPLGLVLAGGLASRMGGGDKTLIEVGGQSILNRVIERMSAQCARVAINANGDPARFAATGLPVIADNVPGFAGPLAGILAGMDWAAANAPEISDLVTVAGDCPFLPRDLVARLAAARHEQSQPIASARSGEWRHPVVALWPVSLRHDLRTALVAEDLRKVEVWAARHGVAIAEWPDRPFDPFFNVNTPEDAARANEISSRYSGA